MNLNHLRHVVTVYRTGSFTAAAIELHLSQSSVTKSVAWAEQYLGYALFDRLPRGVSVTEAGREFIDRAARIVSDVDRLAADSAAMRGERNSVLRIGISPPSLAGLLNRALRSLVRESHEFTLYVQPGQTQRSITLLSQGDIDLLIGPTDELVMKQDFVLERLPDFASHAFCRLQHPLLAEATITRQQLRRYPLVLPDISAPQIDRVVRTLYGVESNQVQVHIIDNFSVMAGIVESTDVLGVASDNFARTETFRRRFQLLPGAPNHPLALSVAWRVRWHPSPPMLRFLKAIHQYPPI